MEIRTVGQLINALSEYDSDLVIGMYDFEDGDVGILELHVQDVDQPETLLYYKGDNPLTYQHDENRPARMLTLMGGNG